MEQSRERNLPKRHWFERWSIVNIFCKPSIQIQVDRDPYDYEMSVYFRTIFDYDTSDDEETDYETAGETDDEREDEETKFNE